MSVDARHRPVRPTVRASGRARSADAACGCCPGRPLENGPDLVRGVVDRVALGHCVRGMGAVTSGVALGGGAERPASERRRRLAAARAADGPSTVGASAARRGAAVAGSPSRTSSCSARTAKPFAPRASAAAATPVAIRIASARSPQTWAAQARASPSSSLKLSAGCGHAPELDDRVASAACVTGLRRGLRDAGQRRRAHPGGVAAAQQDRALAKPAQGGRDLLAREPDVAEQQRETRMPWGSLAVA